MAEDRINGWVKFYERNRRYLFLYDQVGSEYFCHEDDTAPIKGHHCLFDIGTPVTFRIKAANAKSRYKTQACDCRLVEIPETPFWEISTVISWFDTYGFAQRDCAGGCSIFIHQRDISPGIELRSGDRISHRSVETTYKGRPAVEAAEIDLYVPNGTL
jgi:hypothetical protein